MILENRTVQAYSFSRTVNILFRATNRARTRIRIKRVRFFIGYSPSLAAGAVNPSKGRSICTSSPEPVFT